MSASLLNERSYDVISCGTRDGYSESKNDYSFGFDSTILSNLLKWRSKDYIAEDSEKMYKTKTTLNFLITKKINFSHLDLLRILKKISDHHRNLSTLSVNELLDWDDKHPYSMNRVTQIFSCDPKKIIRG